MLLTVIGNPHFPALWQHCTAPSAVGGERGKKGWRLFVVLFVLQVFCLQRQSLCSADQVLHKDHQKNLPWIKNEQCLKIPFSYCLSSMQHSKVTFQRKPHQIWHFIKCRAWPAQHLHSSLINQDAALNSSAQDTDISPPWPFLTVPHSNEFSSCLPCRMDQP